MQKLILGSILLFASVKYGFGFLTSDKFQAYGDRTRAPWTCRVNNLLGEFETMLSRYDKAQVLFEKTLARCPETPMAEHAAFRTAKCLQDRGRLPEARNAYLRYAETYPDTRRAKMALHTAQYLTTP